MAILQSSLSEEYLSKSEKAVLKGVFRANQLCEGYMILAKMKSTFTSSSVQTDTFLAHGEITSLQAYIRSRIEVVLKSTKIPARPKLESTPSDTKS